MINRISLITLHLLALVLGWLMVPWLPCFRDSDRINGANTTLNTGSLLGDRAIHRPLILEGSLSSQIHQATSWAAKVYLSNPLRLRKQAENLRDHTAQTCAKFVLAHRWAGTDLQSALLTDSETHFQEEWIAKLSVEEISEAIRQDPERSFGLLQSLARLDPYKALELIKQSRLFYAEAGEIISTMAETDLQAAQKAVMAFTDQFSRRVATNSLIEAWVQHDVKEAWEWIEQLPSANYSDRVLWARHAAKADPEGALAMAASTDPGTARRLEFYAARELANSSPERVYKIAQSPGFEPERSLNIAQSVARIHVRNDPIEALSQFEAYARDYGIAESRAFHQAYGRIFQHWRKQDAASAMTHAEGLEDNALRAAALQAFDDSE